MSFRSAQENRLALWALVVILAGFLPFLYLHFTALWQREHYRYFPGLLIVLLLLSWSRWKQGEHVTKSSKFTWLGASLLLLSIVLTIVALVYSHPGFGVVAGIMALGAYANFMPQYCGKRIRNSLGLWCLLWLFIALPVEIDQRILLWEQENTTRITSGLLDLLDKPHLEEGTAIVFPQKTFFIDEACGDILSLVSIIAIAAVVAVWRNRTLAQSLILIVSSVFWAALANVARMMIICTAYFKFGRELSVGSGHAMVSLFLLLGILLAILSTDRLLAFAVTPVGDYAFRREPIATRSVFIRWWNWITGISIANREPSPVKEASESANQRPRWIWIYAAIMLVSAGIQLNVLASYSESTKIEASDVNALLKLDAISLSEPGWKLVDYETEHRGARNIFGKHSNRWTFEGPNYNLQFSLDYPFVGWHELSQSYVNRGWKIGMRQVKTIENWPFVDVSLKHPGGENGYLLFSPLTPSGMPNLNPPLEWPHSLWAFTSPTEKKQWKRQYYQTRAWVINGHSLDEQQRAEVEKIFLDLRHQLKEHFMNSEAANKTS